MTIETKYSPRDHVWTIHKNYKCIPTGVKCSFCNGTGYAGDTRCFARDGYKSKCTNGVINEIKIHHTYKERIIEAVNVFNDSYNIEIEYTLEKNSIYDESEFYAVSDESELYATEEEAKAECDRRNAECNSPQQ